MLFLPVVLICVQLSFSFINANEIATVANVTQLIAANGFEFQEYQIFTADGFELGVQRILTTANVSSGVVILQHGLMDTADTWVINNATQSLGFILSNAGYDVWLANARGNKYSPVPNGNWSWNWDQHAEYDIPAVVSFVINVTQVSKVFFIAHSQGATTGFAAFSTNSELASQIALFVALAPVTYLYNETSPLLTLMAKVYADKVLGLLPNGPFILSPSTLGTLLAHACKLTPSLCNNALNSLFGNDSNLDPERIDIYTAHWPDQTSRENMIHWIENTRSGQFQRFDFGAPYDPSQIGCPVAVFAGTQDDLGDVDDVLTLISNTGSQVVYSNVSYPLGHMDFVWGATVFETLYPQVLDLLQGINL